MAEAKPPSPATDVSLNSTSSEHESRISFLQDEIDPSHYSSTYELTFACFMTGFTSAIPFTACFIWCGFQTGNTIQLGLALARLFSNPQPRDHSFEKIDQQALTSLLSFLLGTAIGRIGDKVGARRRSWLIGATMLQALCLMAAALAAFYSGESDYGDSRGEPSWRTPCGMVALAFASASLGIQGYIGKRLNTQFATAVVLTTIWVELINDPLLFARRRVKTRDHKAAGVFVAFLGGLFSRAILNGIGSPGALGIAAGLRVVGALAWLFNPPLQPATTDSSKLRKGAATA